MDYIMYMAVVNYMMRHVVCYHSLGNANNTFFISNTSMVLYCYTGIQV